MKLELRNVRLTFPNLFKKEVFNGAVGKYCASFLIDKNDKENIKKIKLAIDDLRNSNPNIKIGADKICIKDGDTVDYEGYAGCMVLKSSNSMLPTCVNQFKQVVTEDNNIFYSGCFVNVILDFWLQNNQYGKRINSNLLGIQFWEDGERLGTAVATINADEFTMVKPKESFGEDIQELEESIPDNDYNPFDM